MLARMDASEKAQGMEVCQKDLAATFVIVADNVRAGAISGYVIRTEKSSGSEILYDVSERNCMRPLAAMVNDTVFPMPPSINPQSLDAVVQLLVVGTKLREIAASVSPAVTPV